MEPSRTPAIGSGPGTLGTRIFLLSGALIAASVSVAVGFTMWRARQVAEQGVRRALDASQSAYGSFEVQRGKQLRLISRVVASDPSFVAYVAEADPASIRDLLEQRRRSLGCDFAIVLDRAGRLLARTDRPGTGQDLSGRPLVRAAIERGEAAEVWREDGQLASAVAVPLLSGLQTMEGILVTGFALDDELAILLKRAADAEIAFLDFDRGETRMTACTLGPAADALIAALEGADRGLARARAGEQVARLDLRLEGHLWVARLVPLQDAGGAPVGALVMLAPHDRYLGGFRSVAGALALAGAIGVLGAFVVSYSLSRRVTRPIERLARAAEAARAGDYAVAVPTDGTEEVGRLGRAFRDLLAELREQRELEQYLSQLSRQLPDPGAEDKDPADNQPTLAPGAQLGDRFEVLAAVGVGGNGVVYRARDRALHDVVALKVLRRELVGDPEALERLKSELRLARRVTNRHVLRTHDFGELDGVAFISMEYVRGITLRHLLDHGGPLPLAAGLRIARQLLEGLGAAHAMGVLHGDIKPENLLLEPTGNVKLADFGIARPLREAADANSALAGTLHYRSPERLQGRDLDERSDLYACGVVMFEMLAGRRPFVTADSAELFFLQMSQDPPSLRSLRPEVPTSLDDLVRECLAREPGDRPINVEAVRRRLPGLDSPGGQN